MEREELYKLVKEALGSTQLIRVTKRTIEGELDDELDNFGEDEDKNSELVAKIANRLKRMEGNLQHDLAEKIKESREEAEKKRKEREEEEAKKNKSKKEEDDVPQYIKDLQDELIKLKNDRKQEQRSEEHTSELQSRQYLV